MQAWLEGWLASFGLPEVAVVSVSLATLISGVLLLSWLADRLTRSVLLRGIARLAKSTTTRWDDVLLENKVFSRLGHFAPALVIYLFAPLSPGSSGLQSST